MTDGATGIGEVKRMSGHPAELQKFIVEQRRDWRTFKRLIEDLKRDWEFSLARRVLAQAREGETDPQRLPWVSQQLALCTYKDAELPPTRFDQAIGILEEVGLRDPRGTPPEKADPATMAETLALGGAVYKRKWEQAGQLEDLQQALALYLAAWRFDPVWDLAYGGSNAAYILDIMALRASVLARRTSRDPEQVDLWKAAERFRRRARALRSRMLAQLPTLAETRVRQHGYTNLYDEYWYRATQAELHFGLGRYTEAAYWLTRAREAAMREAVRRDSAARPVLDPDAITPAPAPVSSDRYLSWEIQSTFSQLLGIARAHGIPPPEDGDPPGKWHPAWQALGALLKDDTATALRSYAGRIGLALSGGGFRASLFHIGVLARLAETDVLGRVEAISTVSGGSIVGAHYYLLLKQLLSSTPEAEIDRRSFVSLVKRLHDQFLSGIEQNLRTRTLTNLILNFKMFVLRTYSRSHRLGELYEERLYAQVADGHPPNTRRRLRDLLVLPAGSDVSFNPACFNWSRRAKVPSLLLNATSLNSGHNWQFTARSMGEPPGLLGSEVDVNDRYRRLWYDQAPDAELRDFRLGYAVAASACVPALFDPLVLEGLYPGRTVKLVDGGVHDNQGTASLVNEGCTLIVCSDASGQMEGLERPADGLLSVPFRSNDILMSRVREAEYQELRARVDARALQGLMFVHLKKGLDAQPLDWVGCQDPTVPPGRAYSTTEYGVDKDLQGKLAAIRTDLDSFTEVEANALMLSGYLMTEHELKQLNLRHERDGEPGSWGGADVNAPRGEWPFLQLELLMRQPMESADVRRRDLGKQLEVGKELAFKIWRLSPVLRKSVFAAVAVLLLALGWFIRDRWDRTIRLEEVVLSYRMLFVMIAVLVVVTAVPVLKWLQPTMPTHGYIRKTLLAVVGFIGSNIHLWTFDRLFLERGRLKRLLDMK
jgi:predicted acylesterase/phospholipase RssA